MVRPKGDIAKWVPPEEVPPVEKPRFIEPEPPAPRTRTFPGFSGAFTEFIGAGITILTMTDCDTVGGIFALMRVRRGELLNQYENQVMKDLKELEGW